MEDASKEKGKDKEVGKRDEKDEKEERMKEMEELRAKWEKAQEELELTKSSLATSLAEQDLSEERARGAEETVTLVKEHMMEMKAEEDAMRKELDAKNEELSINAIREAKTKAMMLERPDEKKGHYRYITDSGKNCNFLKQGYSSLEWCPSLWTMFLTTVTEILDETIVDLNRELALDANNFMFRRIQDSSESDTEVVVEDDDMSTDEKKDEEEKQQEEKKKEEELEEDLRVRKKKKETEKEEKERGSEICPRRNAIKHLPLCTRKKCLHGVHCYLVHADEAVRVNNNNELNSTVFFPGVGKTRNSAEEAKDSPGGKEEGQKRSNERKEREVTSKRKGEIAREGEEEESIDPNSYQQVQDRERLFASKEGKGERETQEPRTEV